MLASIVAATVVVVGAQPFISIDGQVGDVEVLAGAPGEVRVESVLEGDGFTARVEPSPGGARIVAGCSKRERSGVRRCGPGAITLRVRVPADASVSVSLVRGAISVSGVGGQLALESAWGDVSITDVPAAPVANQAVASLWRASRGVMVRALAALTLLL